jgi:hypothetical protein
MADTAIARFDKQKQENVIEPMFCMRDADVDRRREVIRSGR